MHLEKRNNAVLNLTSSRSVGMRDINALLTVHISRISSRPQGRDDEGRKDKEKVGQVLPDNQIKRHSRMSLSGIPTASNNTQGGDPRLKPSGMTTLLNKSPLALPSPSWRGNTNNPLPPRGGRCPVREDEGEQVVALAPCGRGRVRKHRGEGLLFSSPHVEEVAHCADGGSCVSNTPLPRCAVLSPQGGQKTARGFTLIELLVVILIIGILAAIAVPQYQKAVKKTKYTKMLSWVKKIGQAQEVYYLEHGAYASSLDELGFAISTKQTCTGWHTVPKVDGICIGIGSLPLPNSVWGSIPPAGADWNGYGYILKNYRSVPAGLFCIESRNPGKEDPHCSGTRLYSDAHGKFYSMP